MNATTTIETVLDVLMQLGFWPEDEPGHDWFMSDCGRVRVITDDEEIHVVAWSSNRRLLDALNAIDDAIASGRSEAEGYGTPHAARGLHRTGTTILGRVSSLARRSVEFVERAP